MRQLASIQKKSALDPIEGVDVILKDAPQAGRVSFKSINPALLLKYQA